jgi:hypothetical protein
MSIDAITLRAAAVLVFVVVTVYFTLYNTLSVTD